MLYIEPCASPFKLNSNDCDEWLKDRSNNCNILLLYFSLRTVPYADVQYTCTCNNSHKGIMILAYLPNNCHASGMNQALIVFWN